MATANVTVHVNIPDPVRDYFNRRAAAGALRRAARILKATPLGRDTPTALGPNCTCMALALSEACFALGMSPAGKWDPARELAFNTATVVANERHNRTVGYVATGEMDRLSLPTINDKYLSRWNWLAKRQAIRVMKLAARRLETDA